MTSPTIVEFVEARLTEEAEAAASMPDPEKHRRTVDCLRTICAQVVNHLETNGVTTLTDHPIAAGLLVPAYIWSDHPDHQPAEWFPQLSKMDLKR